MDQPDPRSHWHKLMKMCALSAALIILSSALDRPLAHWVNSLMLEEALASWPVKLIKKFGQFWTIAAIAVAVALAHRFGVRAGAFLLMTGIVGLTANLLKWAIGRTRPFKLEADLEQALPFSLQPFRGSLPGILEQTNLAFPSGHTTVAFAAAAALAILLPKWRLAFYAVAALVAVQRVMANAHWLSDTVAAACLAICGVHLIWRIMGPWVTTPVVAPPRPMEQPQREPELESI
jgi:membrane-associated phospholipid phosphatase